MNKNIFKAYDIRGIYPDEINESDIYKIVKSYCQFLKPKNIAIGCDVRLSSPALKKTAIKAATDQKIKVIDLGIISTDMLYFAVANYNYDGGLSITASHNPKEYNGMKIVKEKASPISSDTGLFEIRDMAMEMKEAAPIQDWGADTTGKSLVEKKEILNDYIEKIKTFADFKKIKPLKIVMNANFGLAGQVAEKLLENTGIKIIKLNCEPNGNFPKGRPDPLIPENRKEISELVVSSGADLGVAWDADADRCFFFTEKGEFIEGYFITALLAKIFLEKNKSEKIIHDTRLTWAIEDTVKKYGGQDIPTKAGHSFIKERMKKENAVFGGEMSAHYYFRDYFYADCGMIPLAMILEFLSGNKKSFSQIMNEMFWQKYFVSGEINNEVKNVEKIVEKIKKLYISAATKIDEQDGISLDFIDSDNWKNSWRFNVRPSNTEPLIRLNVEAGSQGLMEEKRDELLKLIKK